MPLARAGIPTSQPADIAKHSDLIQNSGALLGEETRKNIRKRRPVIFGIFRAGPLKSGGRSAPSFWKVSRPPGAAQSPKIEDLQSVKNHINNTTVAQTRQRAIGHTTCTHPDVATRRHCQALGFDTEFRRSAWGEGPEVQNLLFSKHFVKDSASGPDFGRILVG